MESIHKSN